MVKMLRNLRVIRSWIDAEGNLMADVETSFEAGLHALMMDHVSIAEQQPTVSEVTVESVQKALDDFNAHRPIVVLHPSRGDLRQAIEADQRLAMCRVVTNQFAPPDRAWLISDPSSIEDCS